MTTQLSARLVLLQGQLADAQADADRARGNQAAIAEVVRLKRLVREEQDRLSREKPKTKPDTS